MLTFASATFMMFLHRIKAKCICDLGCQVKGKKKHEYVVKHKLKC